MKEWINRNKLFFDTSVVLLASSLASFLNLIYQLVMVRLLDVNDFSQLSAALSLFSIFAIPAASFSTTITKFVSDLNAQKKFMEIKFILRQSLIFSLSVALFCFTVINILSVPLMNFLKLGSLMPIFILSFLIFFNCIMPTLTAGLQGSKKFGWLSVSSIVNGFSRLLFAVIFVILGLRLIGALSGFLVSSIATFFVTLIPLKEYLFEKVEAKINMRSTYEYAFSVFIAILAFTSLTNIDMILVQHFFNKSELYAVGQIVGKIALFSPAAVIIAMFPHTASSHAKKEDHLAIFKKSFSYAMILNIMIVCIFNVFPSYILRVLTGKIGEEYVTIARWFSMVMAFFTLDNLMFMYQLSVNKFNFIKFLVLFSILQIILITLFHSSLISVLAISLVIAIALFVINLKIIFSKNA